MINKLKKILYSVFPIFTIQFKEFWEIFKDSWLKEYIINWIFGFLIIMGVLLAVLLLASFVVWRMPTFELPSEPFTLGLIRLLLVAYSAFMLGTVEKD